jgi:hypothetical protein
MLQKLTVVSLPTYPLATDTLQPRAHRLTATFAAPPAEQVLWSSQTTGTGAWEEILSTVVQRYRSNIRSPTTSKPWPWSAPGPSRGSYGNP